MFWISIRNRIETHMSDSRRPPPASSIAPSITRSHPRPGRWILPLLAALVLPAAAGLKEDSGWTELQARLGANMPTGAGIDVLHVEYSNSMAGNRYVAPVHPPFTPPPSSTSFLAAGDYAGKTFTLFSPSLGTSSSHARGVAGGWYHLTTGLSPGVTTVHCLLTNDFYSRVFGETLDEITTAPIQNHSWIQGGAASEELRDFLRKYDQYLVDHGAIAMVGLANYDTPWVSGIPPALPPAYHVLSVGRSDGLHKTGTTPAGLDGTGRMKPDLVSVGSPPDQATSWSTGAVSGIVTLLWQGLVEESPAVVGSHRAMAAKALAIAGADKSKFPLWQRASAATPYDATWGAGEADILRSWEILSGGIAGPGLITSHGWESQTPPPGPSTRTRAFTVPSGKFATFSCALVWNRTFDEVTGDPSLRDLGLVLRRVSAPAATIDTSNSTVDNVEYLHRYHLPAGSYEFDVTNLDETAHAIAWHLSLTDGPTLRCLAVSPSSLQLAASGLDPYVTYTVESSTSLAPGSWSPHATLHMATAPVPAFAWTQPLTPTPARRFFRLRWNP